ncbi:hypothetical protein [Synechococcus sp. UW179A]|nr:hypothetical protein [Synechococcus sp. UW179A]
MATALMAAAPEAVFLHIPECGELLAHLTAHGHQTHRIPASVRTAA